MMRVQSLRVVPRSPAPADGDEAANGDALLALLAAGAPPAFATDSRDRIVFWNRGMAHLVGRSSHAVLGRRCYETLQGRDVFGNRFCYANCPLIATAREGDPVCGFEMSVATEGRARRDLGFTIMRIPGARPDLFTLVHIVRPAAREGRSAPAPAEPAAREPDVERSAPPLTVREMEVLRHVASGLPNKDVARALGLSVATVRNHVHNVLEKLGVHSKLEAVSLSFRNGWICR